jgi:hypothetical protein
MPNSFEYVEPWSVPESGAEKPRVCPHCKQPIQPGENVHWFQDTLWHTKPCPG